MKRKFTLWNMFWCWSYHFTLFESEVWVWTIVIYYFYFIRCLHCWKCYGFILDIHWIWDNGFVSFFNSHAYRCGMWILLFCKFFIFKCYLINCIFIFIVFASQPKSDAMPCNIRSFPRSTLPIVYNLSSSTFCPNFMQIILCNLQLSHKNLLAKNLIKNNNKKYISAYIYKFKYIMPNANVNNNQIMSYRSPLPAK